MFSLNTNKYAQCTTTRFSQAQKGDDEEIKLIKKNYRSCKYQDLRKW